MKTYSATISFEDLDDEENGTERFLIDLPNVLDVDGGLNVYLNLLTEDGTITVRIEIGPESLAGGLMRVPAFVHYQSDNDTR